MISVTVVDIFRSIHLAALRGDTPSPASVARDFGPAFFGCGAAALADYDRQQRACLSLARRVSASELFDLVVYGKRQSGKPFSHQAAEVLTKRLGGVLVTRAHDYDGWSREVQARINGLPSLCMAAMVSTLDELLASKYSRLIQNASAYAQSLQTAVQEASTQMTGLRAYALAATHGSRANIEKIISDHFTLSRLSDV